MASLDLSPLKDADRITQGVAIVLDDMTERKKLEAQHRLLERMVSPAVLAQIDPDSPQIGGHRAKLRPCSPISAVLPVLVKRILPSNLSRYSTATLQRVQKQFLPRKAPWTNSWAMLSWPGSMLRCPQPDHTLRAVRAALGLRAAIRKLHAELPPETHLSFGVGIHYGKAVLGWIGTEKRLEYTAIGDCVNTARRIQENAGARNQILISASAFHFVTGKVNVRPAEPVVAKGKRQPVEVYEIIGMV